MAKVIKTFLLPSGGRIEVEIDGLVYLRVEDDYGPSRATVSFSSETAGQLADILQAASVFSK